MSMPPRRGLRFLSIAILSLSLLSISHHVLAGPDDAPAESSAVIAPEDTIETRYVAPVIEVFGSYERSMAPQAAASQGTVTPDDLARRPLLRAGDVLESVPGVLISQHSGEGKANQYYLRGFNLDHGTDFATTIAGVPVNMPTHAHGQGYTDLNFFIPELVSGVQYRKGTYAAEDGDFSSAGSAQISYRNALPRTLVSLTPGEEGYRRMLVAASPQVGSGRLLGGVEVLRNDGPWIHPDDYRKVNGLLRYSRGTIDRGVSVTAMGYDGGWNATDQIPGRAVASGTLPRFGTIDPTDGGETYRYSLSAELQDLSRRSLTKASAYALAYSLNLFSNFTYFLDDTLNGDQFEQADERVVTGLRVSHAIASRWRGHEIQNTVGVHLRHDNIAHVGLHHTAARRRLSTTREDHVVQSSASPFVQSDWRWTPRLRTILGLRAELYRFDVTSSDAENSGVDEASLLSPKVSVILGPWGAWDVYANAGYGFHSNDARGATIREDPVTGEAADRVSPLVRTKGAEVGTRLTSRRASATLSLWNLDIASELVFVGDAGTTEASRPSRRTGIEVSGELRPVHELHLDAALAYSRARFRDEDPAGDRIPGAVEGVISAGAEYEHRTGGFAGVRLRYFGPRPLIEDNSVRSRSSTILNAQLGYRAAGRWTAALQVFNLFDRRTSDIDYFYTSRLPGESLDGIDDVHTHPQEPRSVRLVLSTGLPR
jgi:hypothetical protein